MPKVANPPQAIVFGTESHFYCPIPCVESISSRSNVPQTAGAAEFLPVNERLAMSTLGQTKYRNSLSNLPLLSGWAEARFWQNNTGDNVMAKKKRPSTGNVSVASCLPGNALLASLKPQDRALLEPHLEAGEIHRGDVLFEPGEDVVTTYFPIAGSMISLVLAMQDDRSIEVATIGQEGAVGGIVSAGHKPAFARMVVEIGGLALRLDTSRLEDAKRRSASLRDLFSRYADVLLAQTLQSVACNALHSIEERCSRWLLTTQDRVPTRDLPLTQEFLAELLGVQRTTVSAAAQALQRKGLIRYRRGQITICDRAGLEEAACECYAAVEKHFRAVLPDVKEPRNSRQPPRR
jgi:CRP-like cAMP-binding protein